MQYSRDTIERQTDKQKEWTDRQTDRQKGAIFHHLKPSHSSVYGSIIIDQFLEHIPCKSKWEEIIIKMLVHLSHWKWIQYIAYN